MDCVLSAVEKETIRDIRCVLGVEQRITSRGKGGAQQGRENDECNPGCVFSAVNRR